MRNYISIFFAFTIAQLLCGFAVNAITDGFARPAAILATVPLITILLCVAERFRFASWIGNLLIIAIATTSTCAIMQLLRQNFQSSWYTGPLPSQLDLAFYGTIIATTTVCGTIACVAFESDRFLHRVRWGVIGTMAVLLIGGAIASKAAIWEGSPTDYLQAVVYLEQIENPDSGLLQQLSTSLAVCGRETEAESVQQLRLKAGAVPFNTTSKIDVQQLDPLPWRQVMDSVAKREQLIIIMEAHNGPKHRQWIEQVLPVLHAAGFRDYAAEALTESKELKQRGYPTSFSGYYLVEPSFANVLRAAIKLDFELHSYEAVGKDLEPREDEQAANLAKLLAANPDRKLVIHAGYGHVQKKPDATGYVAMAAKLWERTGIEPFCILQTYHAPGESDALALAKLTEKEQQPVMLMPVPENLENSQFQFSPGAIDAVVVHPPNTGGPGERLHSFPSQRQRVTGTWKGDEWPVLIGAFRQGESANAIALDQAMLREGEREYVLWVPLDEYQTMEIRIFGMDGQIDSSL